MPITAQRLLDEAAPQYPEVIPLLEPWAERPLSSPKDWLSAIAEDDARGQAAGMLAQVAARFGHAEIIRTMVEMGAQDSAVLAAQVTHHPVDLLAPIQRAARHGQTGVVQAFAEAGEHNAGVPPPQWPELKIAASTLALSGAVL